MRCIVVLSPSCPWPLAPQQYACPPEVAAQVWSPPARMVANATPVGCGTATGAARVAVVESPTWPSAFLPQHQACPPEASAQVCPSPTLSWVKVTPVGCCTAVGVFRLVVLPSPSRPSRFYPQQYASPAAVRAQLCEPPAESCANVTPGGCSTAVGMRYGPLVGPTPSRPLTL